MKGPTLVGAKSILRYLKEKHDLVICRQTLHRFRTVPESGVGRLGDTVGADPFPATRIFGGRTVTLEADPSQIDEWVGRRLQTRAAN